ncbi:hypothetical protein OHB26_02650 [Nocardia sp. NBC_01503]|nr:hypothetical protein [Nocardia sp. NBC_01503]WTL33175.1 hypothetical protein OHB26_02650 [Nocardia sp. NBC_01503]
MRTQLSTAFPPYLEDIMNWPVAAVIIALIFALMVIVSTYLAARASKK